jgi:hypothetical protein
MSHESICFVMAPIGAPRSSVRRISDQVLRHLIEPASLPLGYEPIRADKIHAAGDITAQVLRLISTAPLAVADLSGLNPNVMYELAVRHATGKPIAQIAATGTKLPFDVGMLRTIFFDVRDPDNLSRARGELQEQLSSFAKAPNRNWALIPGLDFITARLDEEQTRDIIKLHQASSGFRIYSVIDETVTVFEHHPDSFDPEHFFLQVKNALLESRHLCDAFTSSKLGNLFEFFETQLSDSELRSIVEGGQRILLDPKLDSSTKRKRLLSYVYNAQLVLDSRLEGLLRDEY